MQVKDNQEKLREDCERIGRNSKVYDEYETFDDGRNREEKRNIKVYKDFTLRSDVKKKRGEFIETIVKVTRRKLIYNTETQKRDPSFEEAFYITTCVFSAKKSWELIRNHWWVENKDHYVRDVSMWEDASRIRVNPTIMVKMKSFWLNILRKKKIKNIKLELTENGMDIDRFLARYSKITWID